MHQELDFQESNEYFKHALVLKIYLVQAVLSPPATGSTWNAWWSWSAWTCWREGQHFPLATTPHEPVHVQ